MITLPPGSLDRASLWAGIGQRLPGQGADYLHIVIYMGSAQAEADRSRPRPEPSQAGLEGLGLHQQEALGRPSRPFEPFDRLFELDGT